MKRFSIAFLTYTLLASIGYAPSAQGDQGVTMIAGRVASALRLSVRQGWQPLANQPAAVSVAADSSALNSVQVILSGGGTGASSQVVVPLEMRTNEAYELKLTLISSEGPSPAIFASIGSVRPSGRLVAPRAAEVSRDQDLIDLMRCVSPVTALHGGRISVGGNLTTPANALLADLNLSISEVPATADHWRALLRISVHRAS